MIHHAAADFWVAYRALPAEVQALADRAFALLNSDPHHPSLHFKKVLSFRSIRVGIHHRALGVEVKGGIVWFWIGNHAEYDRLVR